MSSINLTRLTTIFRNSLHPLPKYSMPNVAHVAAAMSANKTQTPTRHHQRPASFFTTGVARRVFVGGSAQEAGGWTDGGVLHVLVRASSSSNNITPADDVRVDPVDARIDTITRSVVWP